jgi:hypothetical protein
VASRTAETASAKRDDIWDPRRTVRVIKLACSHFVPLPVLAALSTWSRIHRRQTFGAHPFRNPPQSPSELEITLCAHGCRAFGRTLAGRLDISDRATDDAKNSIEQEFHRTSIPSNKNSLEEEIDQYRVRLHIACRRTTRRANGSAGGKCAAMWTAM